MRKRWLMGLILSVLCGLIIGGCAKEFYKGALDLNLPPPAVGREEIPYFSYEHLPLDVTMEFKEETKDYRYYFVKIRHTDFDELKNDKARAYYFEQKNKDRPAPILIILPPTGGPIQLVKYIAEGYAEEGFTTLAFYRREQFFNPDKSLEYNVKLFRQTVIDVRRGLDFLETRPHLDMERVGIVGMSLGGIIASLATEADARIKATAIVVSAGNLPKVLATSQYKRVREFRAGMIKKYQLADKDALVEFARPYLKHVDPITYADRIDPARLLMINGTFDNIIKIYAARDTWQAFGKPAWITSPVGHYTSFAIFGQARKWILEHFRRVLNLPNS